MSLKSRLITLVLSLLVATIVAVALVLGWSARTGTSEQTKVDGLVIAKLLARSVGVLDKVPEDFESLIGDQMVTQAKFAAHLVDIAENHSANNNLVKTSDTTNNTPVADAAKEIDSDLLKRFKEIINTTSLGEVNITDSQGKAYIQTNPGPFDLVFSPNDKGSMKEFYSLLTGQKKFVIQHGMIRDDEKFFKYAGVGGIDKSRIVQVGYNLRFLDELKQRVGFNRLVDGLIASGSVNAIWIVSNKLETLAYGSNQKNITQTPSELELDYLEQVVAKSRSHSMFHNGLLKVMSPIFGKDNAVAGATILQLPTQHLTNSISQQMQLAALVAIIAISCGIILTYVMANWLAKPVHKLTIAAQQVESGHFDPEQLDSLCERDDEMGTLARVFQSMVQQVLNREERLDALVKVRTHELEAKTIAVQQAMEQLKTTQAQLIAKEKLASLGQLTSGIAHELKNPLNFVINFSNLSVDLLDELQDILKQQKEIIKGEDFSYIEEIMKDISSNAERIADHGKHAEGIIISMIKHSKTGSDTPFAVEFNKFVEQQVEGFTAQYKDKHPDTKIQVVCDFDPSVEEIKIIPTEIKQVILYLLDNACYSLDEKYDKKAYSPVLTIATKNLDNYIELTIHDNGMGIPENIIDKIFNPFFTTKPTRKGNTGMGLSLSYDIVVQQHRGQLDVESQEEQFAKFVVRLPKELNDA